MILSSYVLVQLFECLANVVSILGTVASFGKSKISSDDLLWKVTLGTGKSNIIQMCYLYYFLFKVWCFAWESNSLPANNCRIYYRCLPIRLRIINETFILLLLVRTTFGLRLNTEWPIIWRDDDKFCFSLTDLV